MVNKDGVIVMRGISATSDFGGVAPSDRAERVDGEEAKYVLGSMECTRRPARLLDLRVKDLGAGT